MVRTERLQVQTRGDSQVVNITDAAASLVAGCGVTAGVATLFVVGSTAGLTTTEYEPGLADHDLKAAFERIAPEDGRYEHENTCMTTTAILTFEPRCWGPRSASPLSTAD
jgi:thiamine phosphate synthase YjbQ (UPF0047 family)